MQWGIHAHADTSKHARLNQILIFLRLISSMEAAGDALLVDTNTRRRAVGGTGSAGLEDGSASGRAFVEVVAVGAIGPCLSDPAVRSRCCGG
jgi:hypothetical protein